MGEWLTDLSFEQWGQHVFDRPVAKPDKDRWWWDDDEPELDLDRIVTAQYVTRLFENSTDVLEPYSEDQVGQGLWGIVSTSCLGEVDALFLRDVEWPVRKRGIDSIYQLFHDYMTPRCTRLRTEQQSQLELICYMWWDVSAAWGDPNDPARQEDDELCLDVMRRILYLDSPGCIESALHGLGHWQMLYPQYVAETVHAFLSWKQSLRDDLRDYALDAAAGCVQ